MAKPGGALILDTSHSLIRSPRTCISFQEGSGNPRDLVRPGRWIQRINGAGWTTNNTTGDGVCGLASVAGHGWWVGTPPVTGGQGLDLPTGACTVVLARRKTDLTIRNAVTFGMVVDASQRLNGAFGNPSGAQWDYGGTFGRSGTPNDLTWPGYTPSTAMEYWVSVAGPSGMALYMNSGTPKATSATAVTRTVNDVGGSTDGYRGNTEFYLNYPDAMDLQEIYFFMILGTEWSAAEVTTWLANPYAFLISGVLPALTNPIIATLPAEPGTAGGVSAMPPDALGGTVRPTVLAIDSTATLQARLNAMAPGDTQPLEAGGLWTNAGATGYGGAIELPQIAGLATAGWVQVVSTRADHLQPLGTRIDAVANAGDLARIMTVNPQAALTARDSHNGVGAPCRGVRVTGLEVFNDPTFRSRGGDEIACTFALGWGATSGDFRSYVDPNTWSKRFIADRCWIHGSGFTARGTGDANDRSNKGIEVSAASDVRICDGIAEGYIRDGRDTAGIHTASCQGPLHVENMYLCATGMGFYMGGQQASYLGGAGPGTWTDGTLIGKDGGYWGGDIIIPTNVIVRRCTSEKLNKWIYLFVDQQVLGLTINPEFDTGLSPNLMETVKPPFEVKFGRKVLFDANTIVNGYSWAGFTFDAIDPQDLQTPNTANGLRRQMIEDVTVRYTVAHGCSQFMQIQSASNPIRRIHVHDNLAPNIQRNRKQLSSAGIIGAGLYLSPGSVGYLGEEEDMAFEHNTLLSDAWSWVMDATPQHGLRARFQNNIWGFGSNGPQVNSEGHNNDLSTPDSVLARQWPDLQIINDALINGPIAPSFFGNPATRTPARPYAGFGPPNNAAGTFILPGHQEDAIIDWNTGVISGGVLKNGATDGKDMGADLEAIAAAQAGAVVVGLRRAKGFKASSRRS
jgi:hypothetical protein